MSKRAGGESPIPAFAVARLRTRSQPHPARRAVTAVALYRERAANGALMPYEKPSGRERAATALAEPIGLRRQRFEGGLPASQHGPMLCHEPVAFGASAPRQPGEMLPAGDIPFEELVGCAMLVAGVQPAQER
jgi:hypothetical protein